MDDVRGTAASASRALLLALGVVSGGIPCGAAVVTLHDIDSGTTSPTGQYRWLDVADQAYADHYRSSYDYTQAAVTVDYDGKSGVFRGTLTATNLKPNFAYQFKLVGTPGTQCNEWIGSTGRWWQEEWNGSEWSNGQNLNNKGDGSSPNPNDLLYLARRDVPDGTSPTGLHYRYTGYLVLGYLVTGGEGEATYTFQADSSYHVLWKTSQRAPAPGDGPVVSAAFDPDPAEHPAYDVDYGPSTVGVYGEWERLPAGGVFLPAGRYDCEAILTEESFHGSGGALAGDWAAAMGGEVQFVVTPEPATLLLLGGAAAGLALRRTRRRR